MVGLRVALPAALGLVLLGSFFLAPATNPPDEYVVSVEQRDHVSNVTRYDDLADGYRQVVDAARANGGTKLYRGHTYPEGVSFPVSSGLTSRAVAQGGDTYLVRFTHAIEGPGAVGIVRTLGSLAGGTALVAYAGYRQFAA